MRLLALIFASVDLLLLAAGIARIAVSGFRGDLAGQGMAQAVAIVGSIGAFALAGPALFLAYGGKHLWIAVILALLAALCVLVVLVAE